MTDSTGDRFEHTVEFDSSIEEVWHAVSDPSERGHWLGAAVELDVRPGGHGRVVDDDGTTRDVVVTEVRERESLAWHWWSDHGELSSVELRLDELDGRTRLHIVETIVPAVPAVATSTDTIGRCSRRWAAATASLWHRVGATAFA